MCELLYEYFGCYFCLWVLCVLNRDRKKKNPKSWFQITKWLLRVHYCHQFAAYISALAECFCVCLTCVLSITSLEVGSLHVAQNSCLQCIPHKRDIPRTIQPSATPGPYWSSSVGTKWCIQKWIEDARDLNAHKTVMYSMFLNGKPYIKQPATKEGISRTEKID